MNFIKITDILVENARSYRNKELILEIVPRLGGQIITEWNARQIIEPYIEQVIHNLPSEFALAFGKMMKSKLKIFAPSVMEIVYGDRHKYLVTHTADKTSRVTQNNADAILTVFVRLACKPHNLELHSKDLLPPST